MTPEEREWGGEEMMMKERGGGGGRGQGRRWQWAGSEGAEPLSGEGAHDEKEVGIGARNEEEIMEEEDRRRSSRGG
jgi:hypothetical protein